MTEEVLRMDNVTFKEKGVSLLEKFNINLYKGEILGLICFNSLGLDVFISLLSQNLPLHYGNVYFGGNHVNTYRYSQNTYNKVTVIDKISGLVDSMTIADNIFVIKKSFRKIVVRKKVIETQTKMLLDDIGLDINSYDTIDELLPYERCAIEILKAVNSGSKVIVLKNISKFVFGDELQKIQGIIRRLSSRGISFIYISGSFKECFSICDRVSVMKNGSIIKVLEKREFCDEKIEIMNEYFGYRNNSNLLVFSSNEDGHPMYVADMMYSSMASSVRFNIYRGNMVVLLDKYKKIYDAMLDHLIGHNYIKYSNSFYLDGKPFKKDKCSNRDFAVISEKPLETMLFYDLSYEDNICFTLDHRKPEVWLNNNVKKSVMEEFGGIIGDACSKSIDQLSALELYTLVYSRILLQRPKVLFCFNPFSGADISLKNHILKLMNKILDKNIAIISVETFDIKSYELNHSTVVIN